MAPASGTSPITVKVAYSPRAGEVDEVAVVVATGATLRDALDASGILQRHPEIDVARHALGVWGQLRPLDAALCEGDRIEVYRPLQVDPKEARRLRQRKQQATCSPRR